MNMIKLIADGCAESVRLSPRRIGEADDTYTARVEEQLQQRMGAAISELRAAIIATNNASDFIQISESSFDDWLNDAGLLNFDLWNEHIERIRA